jgi:hypothetical protein
MAVAVEASLLDVRAADLPLDSKLMVSVSNVHENSPPREGI